MNTNHNPLIAESTLPYGAPDFTKINNDHFREALLQGMDEKEKSLKKLQIILKRQLLKILYWLWK